VVELYRDLGALLVQAFRDALQSRKKAVVVDGAEAAVADRQVVRIGVDFDRLGRDETRATPGARCVELDEARRTR